MATSTQDLIDGSQIEAADDDSIASNETDDGQDHLPEKILTKEVIKHDNTESTWYLVKWENCPVLRSSWETGDLLEEHPRLLEDWKIEEQKRAEGTSKFDLEAFNQAVRRLENAEIQRRKLRRLRKNVLRTLAIAANT